MQNSGNDLENQGMSSMYSDLYNRVKPYIDNMADRLKGIELDDDMIDSIVFEILERVGLSQNAINSMDFTDNDLYPMQMNPNDMDMMFDNFGEFNDFDDVDVLPAMRVMGPNRRRHRNPRRQYPCRHGCRPHGFPVFPMFPNSPEDFVRWLLWRQIWGF